MTLKIAVTTSTFAQDDQKPLVFLKNKKCDIVRNTLGRTLSKEETISLLKGCVGVVAGLELYDSSVLQKLKELKVISRVGVGTDNIDLDFCKKNNIQVFKTPDAPVQAVAELTLGFMLNLLRHVSLMDRNTHQGIWQKMMGNVLSQKKVGIIGLGKIGREVARLCEAFGADVLFYDPFVKANQYSQYKALDLKSLLQEADIISLHVPLTDKSNSLIGTKEIALMKKNALLINCSRGEIIDEAALYKALKEKKIQGAALDVYREEPYKGPLQKLDNIILTPHIGSYAKEIRVKMEIEAVDNLIKGLSIHS